MYENANNQIPTLESATGKMGSLPPIRIVIEQADAEAIDLVFTRPFRIGRDVDSDIKVQNSHVSRNHVEVDYKDHCWWVHDLDSTNGIYLNGKKVKHAPVMDGDALNLGKDGPRAVFSYLSKEAAATFIRQQPGYEAGKKWTMGPSRVVLIVVAALLLGGFGFFYGRRQLDQQEVVRDKAETLFAEIRSADIAIAGVYAEQEGTDKLLFAQRLIELEQGRKDNFETYTGYLIQLGLYQALDDQQSQIYNVARFFNESELAMPSSFIYEVQSVIFDYWLDEGEELLKEALTRAQLFEYTPYVVKSLEDYGLPTEFFYLPVTISGFDADAERQVSEGTHIAGMWQLSRATGASYGLKGVSEAEEFAILPVDGRYEFQASTNVAVKLLHDIYRKEAMASGLLTLAVYLQHEQQTASTGRPALGSILSQVPADLEARNIWAIREQYPQQISDQVYEQVVRIFAAAVIGQDPQLFGLDILTPTAVNTYKSFR